jgi:hypothetical protein
MELILELDGGKKKNQEMQKMAIVQKMEIEHLLKQCSQHELLGGQQSDHILELEDRVKDLLSNIQVSSTRYFFLHCTGLQHNLSIFPIVFCCEISDTCDENLP